MKRFFLFTAAVLAIATLVAAQGAPSPAPQPNSPASPGGQLPNLGRRFAPGGGFWAKNPPQAASLEGKLSFVDGKPLLQTKDKTYWFAMPKFYYYAYTDSIKDGAAIKADGFVLASLPGQDKAVFAVTKAVINGKTYDFTPGGAKGMMGGRRINMGPGMMGDLAPFKRHGR